MEKMLSIVIPVKNEEKSILELYSRLSAVLEKVDYKTEIIFIDDGSRDGTMRLIKEVSGKDKRVKAISFIRNFQKSAALSAGFEAASGDIVVTMDGDLQHEPESIPDFLKKMEEGYDIAISWRHKRRDNLFTRRFPSMIANKIIAKMSGLKLHDFGGTFHCYKKEVLDGLELYSELHRFIPALVNFGGGYKVAEVPIENPDRKHGRSNYGLGRIIKVIFDLITVKYFSSFVSRSLQFFGLIGLVFISLGTLGGIFLIYRKIFMAVPILTEHGPLFIVSIFCLMVGVQFITFGIMSEVLIRVYHKTNNRKTYKIRERINF